MSGYRDRWISCDGSGIRIRGYYFPWGTKRIGYERIRTVQRVDMRLLTGRIRIWGTANPRYWANLDPRRPTKRAAVVLDTGALVRPFLTPDDPNAFVAAIESHTPAPVETGRGKIV